MNRLPIKIIRENLAEIPVDQRLSHIKAMEKLRDAYANNNAKGIKCPLCLDTAFCDRCFWIIIKGYNCGIEKAITERRRKNTPRWRRKRTRELTFGIKCYKESINEQY